MSSIHPPDYKSPEKDDVDNYHGREVLTEYIIEQVVKLTQEEREMLFKWLEQHRDYPNRP